MPPIAELHAADGKLILTLEKADISRLLATGWKPPTPITVKARDGSSDLYGLMFKPTTLDPAKKYPIVNHIYPGPQTGSVGGRTFSPARGDAQALAELGFIVVEIDGMGTPWRSKKFHEAYYANMGDNTIPDQVTAMQQLAQRFPWVDIDRAGIYGHSGANKDFDLLMLPNRGHGFGNEPYMVRRRWDYFVRHLLGAEPPKDYQLHPPTDGRQSSQ